MLGLAELVLLLMVVLLILGASKLGAIATFLGKTILRARRIIRNKKRKTDNKESDFL